MGVPLGRLAEQGGENSVSLSHDHSVEGSTGGFAKDPLRKQRQLPFLAGWEESLAGGKDGVPMVHYHHDHKVSFTSGGGLSSTENRPAYYGTLKLMCTNPNSHAP